MIDKETKRLASIFEAMENGVYIIKDDYTVEFMNKTFISDFGEGTGKKCYQVIANRDEICPRCRAKEVFAGETLRREHYFPHINKTYEIVYLPLKNADGTVSRMCIYRDITDRKEREKKLSASKDDYRRLFEHVRCGVYISSKEGKFLDANQALLDMLGYKSKEEFLKMDIVKDLYLRPEDRQKYQEMIERDGYVIDYEVDLKHKDGRVIPVLLTGHVRYDHEGNVIGYEGINVDQSQRKQMEQKLKKAHDFQKNLIQSSIHAIIASDKDGTIIVFNQGAENLLGYCEDEVVRKMSFNDLFPVGGVEELREKLLSEEYGGKNRVFLFETYLIDKTGNKIPVQLSARVMFAEGKEIGIVGFFRDLREIRRLEQEFADQARLLHEHKMISLGRLSASVVHEINNPLAGILNYVRLMLKILNRGSLDQEYVEKFQRYLTLVESETSRCSKIVSNLLAFSRKSKLELSEMNINELLQKCIMLSQHKLVLQDIRIKTDLDPEIPKVWGDFNQIQQCVINLIFNAIDAMPEGGTLIMRSSFDLKKEMVEVKIEDTGCGIASEDLHHIFDPFYSTKMEGKGLGLGLSTVFGIIDRHKGTINVDSELGKGTVFTICLPVGKRED